MNSFAKLISHLDTVCIFAVVLGEHFKVNRFDLSMSIYMYETLTYNVCFMDICYFEDLVIWIEGDDDVTVIAINYRIQTPTHKGDNSYAFIVYRVYENTKHWMCFLLNIIGAVNTLVNDIVWHTKQCCVQLGDWCTRLQALRHIYHI